LASKAVIKKTIQRLNAFYPDGVRADVLADALQVSEEEANSLLVEFNNKPPTIKRPRQPRKKIEPVVVRKEFDATKLIRWLMLIIAVPALLLSAYFSVSALGTSLPFFVAFTMGTVLITFATVAFEATVLFRRDNNKMWIATGIMWLVLMVFSAASIITSLYNNYVSREDMKEKEAIQTEAVYTTYSNAKDAKEQAIEAQNRAKDRMKGYQIVINELDTLEKQNKNRSRYIEAISGLKNTEEAIQKQQVTINNNTEIMNSQLKENPELLQAGKIKRDNAYQWLGRIFGISEGLVQFYLQTIPAVCLDLLASLAFYVFFFPKKKEEQNGS
jgi:hypothetical protein